MQAFPARMIKGSVCAENKGPCGTGGGSICLTKRAVFHAGKTLSLSACSSSGSLCLLAPLVGRPLWQSALTGGGNRLTLIGKVVGADHRASADLHLPGQSVEALPSLPAAVNLLRQLLLLRNEWLARLPWLPTPTVNPCRRPVAGAVEMKGITYHLGPNAKCP